MVRSFNSQAIMRIIHYLPFWPEAAHNSVMALGNFDGMHAGHQAVIARAKALAHAQHLPLAVMAFEPHPRRFFKPDLPILRIVPFAEKARLLREAGVDFFYVAKFDSALSHMSAENFIQDILRESLKVAHVVTGHNFAFGYKRQGDSGYLADQAQKLGFGYTKIEAVSADDMVFSSSAVREALAAGRIPMASAILGRPYAMRGIIIHGDKRGRTIGFPTANIRPDPLFLPRMGVYAVLLKVDGESYPGVANLGVRPTFNGEKPLLEVHILNRSIDLYDKKAKVEFIEFIRPERKFGSLEELKAQIAADAYRAKEIHALQETIL